MPRTIRDNHTIIVNIDKDDKKLNDLEEKTVEVNQKILEVILLSKLKSMIMP